MKFKFIIIIFFYLLYSCSPINKQHGYKMDDLLLSAQEMEMFEINKTTKTDIYSSMGSPSIEITDVNNVWIYLISLKEKNVFEDDEITFQTIFRFEFDNKGRLIKKDFRNQDNFTKIAFAKETTKVRRDAYGITDQLYEAFTRGR